MRIVILLLISGFLLSCSGGAQFVTVEYSSKQVKAGKVVILPFDEKNLAIENFGEDIKYFIDEKNNSIDYAMLTKSLKIVTRRYTTADTVIVSSSLAPLVSERFWIDADPQLFIDLPKYGQRFEFDTIANANMVIAIQQVDITYIPEGSYFDDDGKKNRPEVACVIKYVIWDNHNTRLVAYGRAADIRECFAISQARSCVYAVLNESLIQMLKKTPIYHE